MVMAANIGNSTASVNGYLTGAARLHDRSFYRPMLDAVIRRVEDRLKVVKLSAAAASRKAGLSEDAIRNLRRAGESGGRKGVSTDTLAKLAPVLGTTTGWLLDGSGPENAAPSTVPLVGYVGAGDAAHFYATSDDNLGEVEKPEGSKATRAAEIRGTSLGPLLERWLVYFGDARPGVPPEFFGELCVVGLPDDRVLVKQVRPTQHPGYFHLFSNNEPPMLDEEVVWSAKVTDLRPR